MTVPVDDDQIADAHFHIWDTAVLSYPWLLNDEPHGFGTPAGLPRRFTFRDYLRVASTLRLHPAVHVEAAVAEGEEAAELMYVSATTSCTDITPVVKIAGAGINAVPADQLIVGRRVIVSQDPSPRWTFGERTPEEVASTLGRAMRTASEERSVLEVQLYPEQHGVLVDLMRLQDYPPRLIVNHSGMPRLFSGAGAWDEWDSAVRHLAALPTVAIKLGGLRMVRSEWSDDAAHRIIDAAVTYFGPDRVMFGSNLPVDPVVFAARFADVYRASAARLDLVSERRMLRENVSRWYA